jgi:hypothetical protein
LLGQVVQYTWDKDGSYNVTLTVTDSDGLTGTSSVDVTVGPNQCNASQSTFPQIGQPRNSLSDSCNSACTNAQLGAIAFQPVQHVSTQPFRIPPNGPFYDGIQYELELKLSPDNCTLAGQVMEVVSTISSTCSQNPPRRAYVSSHDVVRNDPLSHFTWSFPDIHAFAEGDFTTSCDEESRQFLLWLPPSDPTRYVNLTPNGVSIALHLVIDDSTSTFSDCYAGLPCTPVPYQK